MDKGELVTAVRAMRDTADDNTALSARGLYPQWTEGITAEVGSRYRHEDTLYKCVQAHITQSDWTPDVSKSLWTVIDVVHEGTLSEPIPAVSGMEYIKGKYYISDGIIYLMNREGMNDGEGVTLYYLPSDLVGQYFEISE